MARSWVRWPLLSLAVAREQGAVAQTLTLQVINKTDLAPHVGASLEVMDRDTRRMRGERPFVFTNLMSGEGLDRVVQWLEEQRARGLTAPGKPRAERSARHDHHHDVEL